MKFVAMVFFVVLCAIPMSAQQYIFDKGSLSIGGSIGFSSASVSGASSSVTMLFLRPSVGTFFVKNLETGVSLNISSTSGGGSSETSTFIGPYARYYFTEGRPILTPYGGVGVGFGSIGGSSTTRIAVTGGAAYVVAKNITIDAGLTYSTGNSLSIIQLLVGLGIYLW